MAMTLQEFRRFMASRPRARWEDYNRDDLTPEGRHAIDLLLLGEEGGDYYYALGELVQNQTPGGMRRG
jgi:hypothetical protein